MCLRKGTTGGAYSAPADALDGFQDRFAAGEGGGEEGRKEGRGGNDGKGGERMKWERSPLILLQFNHW